MTSQQSGSVRWRQTAVVIRSDIFEAARAQGIDVSGECNRALAERVGIDFSQQKIPEQVENPVIIAKEGAPAIRGAGERHGGTQLHPVLNAEDPSARAHLLKMKKEPLVQKPATGAVPAEIPNEIPVTAPAEQVKIPAAPAPERPRAGGKKTDTKAPQKKGKDDLIRNFLAQRVLRTEPSGGEPGRIPKDDLYPFFVRWCNERAGKAGAVPDKRAFTVALKNRFAMEEISENGVRSWKNVRLR